MASFMCLQGLLLSHFLNAGDAYFNTTIRGQAGDQLSLGLDAVTLGAGHRAGFATPFNGNLASWQTLADQEVCHSAGASF